jgi:hypothetical protein
MRVRLAVLLVLLPLTAQAEFFVCGDGGRPQCAGTTGLTRVLPSEDPSRVTDPTCAQVPDNQIDAQKTLLQTVAASHANGRCHLKVVSGLAVEMSAGEKTAVNTAIQAKLDEQQDYSDAVTNNDLCSATLDELTTAKTALLNNLQGDIDGISNIATAKTELADMMGRLVNAMEKLMRCIRGRAGPPQ